MNLQDNLRALRDRFGLTQVQLAERIGVSNTTVSSWEQGTTYPSTSNIQRMMEVFSLTEDDIRSESHGLAAKMRGDVRTPVASHGTAPLVGRISAGEAREAIGSGGEAVWVAPEVLARYPDGFYLVVSGDSMNKVLPEGAYAYVNPSERAASGDLVAINVNGDDATIKRLFYAGDSIVLHPESTNPEHQPRLIQETDPDAPRVRIVGQVVWYTIPFKSGRM